MSDEKNILVEKYAASVRRQNFRSTVLEGFLFIRKGRKWGL